MLFQNSDDYENYNAFFKINKKKIDIDMIFITNLL